MLLVWCVEVSDLMFEFDVFQFVGFEGQDVGYVVVWVVYLFFDFEFLLIVVVQGIVDVVVVIWSVVFLLYFEGLVVDVDQCIVVMYGVGLCVCVGKVEQGGCEGGELFV